MVITKLRADELIPGDVIDSRCGVGEYAWVRVVSVRVEEINRPGAADRIVIEYVDTVGNVRMGERTTRRMLGSSLVRVKAV